MKRFFLFLTITTFSFSSLSLSSIVEARTVGRKVKRSAKRSSATSRFAAEGMKLRKTRRVAIGTSAGGALGLVGANIELNFSPKVGFMAGYGGGTGFQSYSLELKQYIGGDSFLPYIAGGFTHWWGRGREEGLNESKPNYLVEKFLNDTQKRTGEFTLDMVYPSLGVQYVQLDGEYAGLSFFAEVVMMINVADLNSAPTGGVGVMYYF